MAKIKDPVSGGTHALGAIASIVGLVFLIIWSVKYGEGAWDIVSFTIFGVGLLLLYTFSALYHLLNLKEKGTNVMRKFDHIMIYVLIAATYTPIALGPLREVGGWGWSVFGIIWGFAIAGIVLTAVWLKAPRWLTTSIYIAMGWVVVIAAVPMLEVFLASTTINGVEALLWLLAGGIFYTIGGVIYGLKWPKIETKYFGFHEIFHIFVMLGSLCHYWFVIRYILNM